MTSVTPIQVYIGDTWLFPCELLAAGAPLDMTGYTIGADLYFAGALNAVPLTMGNGGVGFTDAALGKYLLTVTPDLQPAASTIAQDPATSRSYPTRIRVWDVDTQGVRTTRGIIYIVPLDPRSA